MVKRFAESEVRDALGDTPVALIHGPRQTGKSTLAQAIGKERRAHYLTLDDPVPRSLAETDPAGLIQGFDGTLIIDEVQRAPQLFLALKSAIDRDRRPGRFLLTGSANVLSLPKIADSLAGRIAIVDLHPFSQAEIEGSSQNFVDRMLDQNPKFTEGTCTDIEDRVVRGGFPEPLSRPRPNRRDAWFADYVRTLLERDVRDLANIEGLAQMPRLLRLLATRCGSALNVVDLAAETKIPNTTLHRYLDLLQALFLTFQFPAWSFDGTAKLTKTPKTFLVDTGLTCYLRNLNTQAFKDDPDSFESVLMNFVAAELRKLTSTSESRPILHHLRTVRRLEVDFVLEHRGGELAGVTVTRSDHLLPEHLAGLQFLKELAGDRFVRGIVLYQGEEVLNLGKEILAVPIANLWRD